jgi:hypothetical protein
VTAEPSRSSTIGDPGFSGAFRIDREGTWHHEGVEVTHPGVLRNLYANLRAEGGHYHLQAGPFRVPVEVDDAPFVVLRAETLAGSGAIDLHLTDGSRERLRADTLILNARGIPYCRVKDGRYPARLSVAAWLQLAERVEPDATSGDPSLLYEGQRFVLRRAG